MIKINFIDSFQAFWLGYFNFKGRAPRSEYWWNALISVIIILVLIPISYNLAMIYSLASFIPSLALDVRRLHDINLSGWWVILFGVLFSFLMIVIALIPTKSPHNSSNLDHKTYVNGHYTDLNSHSNDHHDNSGIF